MSDTTAIAWADSTWSPWIGCTEVSPGCDACYARALDARHKYGGATHWGAGIPRYRVKDWTKPRRWNAQAAASGKRWTVFPSLCDPFDNEVPRDWRIDLWNLIDATPALTWLLLTKRIGNFKRIYTGWEPPPNVWIGASIVNQEEADRDIPKLLATPATVRFVSYEPALGPVDFTAKCPPHYAPHLRSDRIAWVIVGGESRQGKHEARRFEIEWARSTIRQCKETGIAAFMKQCGSHVTTDGFMSHETRWPDYKLPRHEDTGKGYFRVFLNDRAGADPSEWPADLRVQEFPAAAGGGRW